MVTKFRNATKSWVGRVVVGFFFGIIALSFALWGIGDVFRGDTNPTVATVGSSDIKVADLDREFQTSITNLERQFGQPINRAQAQAFGLLNSSLSQLVNRALLQEEARDLGLGISDAAVVARIQANPQFRDTSGNYNADSLRARLRNVGISEAEFVANEKVTALYEQLFGTVADAAHAPKAALDLIARYNSEKRGMNWIVIPADAEIADPGDAELEEYLAGEDGRQFEQPEYRSFDLIQLSARDVVEEGDYTEADLLAEYEAVKGSLGTPEQRRIEQISFADEAAASDARSRILAGEDFFAIAKEVSGLEADETKLGLLQFTELSEDYAKAAFSAPLNDVSAPVSTPLGWRLFRVTEIIPGNSPAFEDVRDDMLTQLITPIAQDRFYELTRDIEDKLAGGDSLKEVASSLGLQLDSYTDVSIGGVDADGNHQDNLKDRRAIMRTAFDTDEGIDSGVIESEDNVLYVLQVNKITAAAVPALADIRDRVLASWTAEEQAVAAVARASDLLEQVKAGAYLASIAVDEELLFETSPVITRTESLANPVLDAGHVASLFDTAKGDGFIARAANSSAQILAVTNIVEAGSADLDADAAAAAVQQLQDGIRNDILAGFATDLNAKYEVGIRPGVIERFFSGNAPIGAQH